ncbi:Ralf-like [Thalictrum thalictroides]|uniref:Ralf-like n=1 Tax=Thalictrum thalictroides TaxID=46969 RepID=A0A7J6V455_THATH|nr:Ralf-like [Thalictrum thalictroides]
MAFSSHPKFLLLLCFFLIIYTSNTVVEAQLVDQQEASLLFMSDASLEWPSTTMSSSFEEFGEEEDDEGGIGRRSLFWRRVHYYISYGALSANRIPCAPRSGRSYYSHNCYKARGVANPYHRGCSQITRCKR